MSETKFHRVIYNNNHYSDLSFFAYQVLMIKVECKLQDAYIC